MAFWYIGDEEHAEARLLKAGLAAAGLYYMAGSWCMRQVWNRPEIPTEWFVPDTVVRGWSAQRAAGVLVREELWHRASGGYTYRWIRPQNTADELRRQRGRERKKWEQKQAKKVAQRTDSAGDSPGEV